MTHTWIRQKMVKKRNTSSKGCWLSMEWNSSRIKFGDVRVCTNSKSRIHRFAKGRTECWIWRNRTVEERDVRGGFAVNENKTIGNNC